MTMLKDIYAKKPQSAAVTAAAGVAQGASIPFTLICSPTRNASKAVNETTLEDKIAQLTESLYQIDLDGKLGPKSIQTLYNSTKKKV